MCWYTVQYLCKPVVLPDLAKPRINPRKIKVQNKQLMLIYIYAFSRCFYPKQLTVHSGYTFFVSMCVPWELNPQPFALLMQCSTIEPHDYYIIIHVPESTILLHMQCCQLSNFVAKLSNYSDYPSNVFFQKHLATSLAIFYIYLATFIKWLIQ